MTDDGYSTDGRLNFLPPMSAGYDWPTVYVVTNLLDMHGLGRLHRY